MSNIRPYVPKDWETGELITESALDHIEHGISDIDNDIANAGGLGSLLRYSTQTLTTEQKEQARQNIGIPSAPTTNGTYILKCTVNNGVVNFNWVLDE